MMVMTPEAKVKKKVTEQLKKLGASCDWERTKFTMDEDMSAAVINVFVDLYRYFEGPAFRRWPLVPLAGLMYYG